MGFVVQQVFGQIAITLMFDKKPKIITKPPVTFPACCPTLALPGFLFLAGFSTSSEQFSRKTSSSEQMPLAAPWGFAYVYNTRSPGFCKQFFVKYTSILSSTLQPSTLFGYFNPAYIFKSPEKIAAFRVYRYEDFGAYCFHQLFKAKAVDVPAGVKARAFSVPAQPAVELKAEEVYPILYPFMVDGHFLIVSLA